MKNTTTHNVWNCTITDTAVHLPPSRVGFSDLRAAERTNGYLYLTEPGADYGLPYGRWGDPPVPHIEAMYRDKPTKIHLAGRGVSSSDLALAAATDLLSGLPVSERQRIGAVIHCHASVNEDVADSIACRLQYELGLKTALPFSVSQNLCSVLVALRLASALLHGPEKMERVLIVASEKWLFPFLRGFGRTLVFEDGAAAALVAPPGERGWQIGAITVDNETEAIEPFWTPLSSIHARIVRQGARVVTQTLHAVRLSAGDLSFAIHPNLDHELTDSLMHESGVLARGVKELRREGHLSAAESIANLDRASHNRHANGGETGMLWSAGLCGEFGCCVVRMNGEVRASATRGPY